MADSRKSYPRGHWLKSEDPNEAMRAYTAQQRLAYSRVKNAFVRELLGDLSGKRVLDYGCGAGFFSVYAAEAGADQVVAVDAEETAVRTARAFARSRGVERVCTFLHREGFPRELADGRMDVVLMKDVIEHVPDDQALLNAAAEALVPGGRLVLSTQNALSLNYLLQGAYHRLWLGNKDWCGWDPTHLRFYTPMSLGQRLEAAGLRAAAWRSVYLIPYHWPGIPGSRRRIIRVNALSWIDRMLGGVFPYNRVGWNIIVGAETSPLVSRRLEMAELSGV
jgi:2-polyprenyl-6-hydroxyphenyl methylase / 3-demethylubiquinone-9 3-methyltransferase